MSYLIMLISRLLFYDLEFKSLKSKADSFSFQMHGVMCVYVCVYLRRKLGGGTENGNICIPKTSENKGGRESKHGSRRMD